MASNSKYSMMDSMDIRCVRCGYENNPQFRFCGMCGAALRPRDPETASKDQDSGRARNDERKTERESDADIISRVLAPQAGPPSEPMPVEPLIAELTAAQKQQAEQLLRTYSLDSREESYPQESFHGERTPIPVSGPSFLGLSDNDNSEERRVEYLLEDEDHSGRAGKFVIVLFILAIAGTGLFYWRKAGYPWPSRGAAQSASTNVAPPPTTTDESNSVMPSEEPPPPAKAGTPAKPKTPAPAPAEQPAPQVAAPVNPAPAAHPSDTQNAEQEASTAERAETKSEGKTEPDEAESLPPVSKPAPAMSAKVTRPITPKAAPATTVPNPAEDSSFLEGQKYLYGTGGVAANCARASQYLTASANNNNSKAESTLATMYATGHCVRRDLPLAYRWFARALHEDPRNTRLERDVQIMWDQMSPQERNLALKNQ